MEVFSRHLTKAVEDRHIFPYYSAHNVIPITHLLYADDMLIFTNGGIDSVDHLMSLIHSFCDISGLLLNNEKSSIFISNLICDERKEAILKATNFMAGSLPTSYLGAPLFAGRAKIVYFEDLVEKVISCLHGWMTNIISIGGRVVLIQSVLASLPIHIMAVISIPKKVLSSIESHMANFLWDQGEEHRKHWVSWSKACNPKALGGLGFRSLQNTMRGLHAKLAFQYLKQESLWARFMHSKYHGKKRKGSSSWSSIWSLIPTVQQQVVWVIGDGLTKVDRMLEVFCSTPNTAIAGLSLKEVIFGNKLDILNACLPVHAQLPYDICFSSIKDTIVWSYNINGRFCTKTFLNIGHPRLRSDFHKIWHSWIPTKISVFVWRLGNRAVPTDDRIAAVGVQLASRCWCCVRFQCETIEHLFVHSDAAKHVWSHFCSIFDKPYGDSLHQMFRLWVSDSNLHYQAGSLAISTFLFGLWEIWKHRNTKRHGKVPIDLILSIKQKVSKYNKCYSPRLAASFGDEIIIKSFNSPIKVPRCIPKVLVAWNPCNGITANLEVSSDVKKGSIILRNFNGSLIFGHVYMLFEICREANFIYLLRRLLTACNRLKLCVDEVQISSRPVCSWLNQVSEPPWLWIYPIRQCKLLLQSAKVVYIPRKVNSTAKALSLGKEGKYDSLDTFPKKVRALFRADLERVPVLVPKHEAEDVNTCNVYDPG